MCACMCVYMCDCVRVCVCSRFRHSRFRHFKLNKFVLVYIYFESLQLLCLVCLHTTRTRRLQYTLISLRLYIFFNLKKSGNIYIENLYVTYFTYLLTTDGRMKEWTDGWRDSSLSLFLALSLSLSISLSLALSCYICLPLYISLPLSLPLSLYLSLSSSLYLSHPLSRYLALSPSLTVCLYIALPNLSNSFSSDFLYFHLPASYSFILLCSQPIIIVLVYIYQLAH